MLTNPQIEAYAKDAGSVAYMVLGLDCKYTISFINDPDIAEDARLDTYKNEVQIKHRNRGRPDA